MAGDVKKLIDHLQAAKAEAELLIVGPPPPPPPVGDLSWFLSKAPGTITNIGSAVLHSLNPWPAMGAYAGQFGAILAASGMAFCPWLGKAGSLIVFGGGHDDYWGNDVYRFDLFTRVWTQLKPPNWPLFTNPALNLHSKDDEGEHWADATFTTTRQDQPSSGHNYGLLDAYPPDASYPQGGVITYARLSLTRSGQRGGRRAHIFNFATMQFERFSTNLMSEAANYAGAFIDKGRNRAIVPGYTGMHALDLATRTFLPKLASFATHIHMTWSHCVQHDVYVGLLHRSNQTYLWVFDPATNKLTMPGISGAWPTPGLYDGGSTWSNLLDGVVHYHGQQENVITLVKPPTSGNVRTTPWTVSSIPFAGDPPAKDTMSGAGAHCKRFLEHEAAGGYLWLGQTASPAQFIKVV